MTQSYIETDCTFHHKGRAFTAGGAIVMPDFVVGYVGEKRDDGTRALTSWHGETLGTIRLTSSWATPRSFVSSRMYQAYAVVDGITYTGRTAGTGMSFCGKRVAA